MTSSTTPDRIAVSGITGRGWHGVLRAERDLGQVFVVDLVVGVDLAAAGRSDDLADTIDYAELAQVAHDHITGQPHDLVERLADAIATDILDRDRRIETVQVTVHKPGAPIPVPFGDVAVTVVRAR